MGRVLRLEELPQWRSELRAAGKRLVVTNGVFDLMHCGHAEYLAKAASFGDAMLVLVNDDASVRELKGPSRPIISEEHRASMLCALGCVTAAAIFHGARCTEALRLAQPDVYAKGGDYTIDTLNREEYSALQECGAQIELLHFVPGCSTTAIVKKILEEKNPEGEKSDLRADADYVKNHLDPRIKDILRRRSIRQFLPRAVENRDLAALLEAGMSAPSARATYPVEYLVITEPEELRHIADILPNGRFLPSAGACIIVCGDISKACGGEESYMLQDCSASIENILLAASQIGLGACWLGIHPRPERLDALRKFFQLPGEIIPVGGIAIGWPAESKEPRSQYDAQKIHLNKW